MADREIYRDVLSHPVGDNMVLEAQLRFIECKESALSSHGLVYGSGSDSSVNFGSRLEDNLILIFMKR